LIPEQELFLSMMQSCGVCFVYSEARNKNEDTVYIAPELLPDGRTLPLQLDDLWRDDPPGVIAEFSMTFCIPALSPR
jgi:internalin A